mgnify:CR=1 FL=1
MATINRPICETVNSIVLIPTCYIGFNSQERVICCSKWCIKREVVASTRHCKLTTLLNPSIFERRILWNIYLNPILTSSMRNL